MTADVNVTEVEGEECAPDCDERAACDKVGNLGHSMCGRCEHGEPRHHGEHFRCARADEKEVDRDR